MGLLRRALDDLNEGFRSLFGPGGSRPDLVRELLEERRTPAPPRRARPERSRRGPPRAASPPRLVRVK